MVSYQSQRGARCAQLLESFASNRDPSEPCFGPVVEPEPLPLTQAQQIALLTLRNSDHGLQVIKALRAKGATLPTRADYEALIPHGLALRNRNGYHAITPIGHHRASLLAHALAAALGIRLVSYRTVYGRRSRITGMSEAGNA